MRERHVAVLTCGISLILFLAALRSWLPFYAGTDATGTDFTVLTVKVTLDGKPMSNAKVTIYAFLTPLRSDPANLGSPMAEGFTNDLGEISFVISHGNYTVRVETNHQWYAENAILREHEQEVNIDFFSVQQKQAQGIFPRPSLGYTNISMLCIASALMATGVTIFMRSRKRS